MSNIKTRRIPTGTIHNSLAYLSSNRSAKEADQKFTPKLEQIRTLSTTEGITSNSKRDMAMVALTIAISSTNIQPQNIINKISNQNTTNSMDTSSTLKVEISATLEIPIKSATQSITEGGIERMEKTKIQLGARKINWTRARWTQIRTTMPLQASTTTCR